MKHYGSDTYLMSADIGGTFTDAIVLNLRSGRRYTAKTPSVPQSLSSGVMVALEHTLDEADRVFEDISRAVHGTTIVSNLILQRRGAKTALITTKGFRDVLQIGRERRYNVNNLTAAFPIPFVTRQSTFEVDERTLADGTIHIPLDTARARETLNQISVGGFEAVAVCLLHAYRNPTNENLLGELIDEVLPNISYSISSRIVPEFREYERTSTTVMNAYAQPSVGRYMSALVTDLAAGGYRRKMYVMMSTGGIASSDVAAQFPVRLLESGPAAGALAAAAFSKSIGEPRLLSFDMGGTTAKACIVDDGIPTRTKYFETAHVERFSRGSGVPVRSPVIDMIEIGAGGGSIASINSLGLLQVGPQSAEADPGPACYGRGGDEPTVTDADLVLGFLDADSFAGGTMHLHADRAEEAVSSRVGKPLGMDTEEAAWGIYQVVTENMASAARVHFAEKGRDSRNYVLFAFGGAGPLHATEVARRLHINRVIVPSGAGVLSAFGMLAAPVSFDFIRTYITRVDRMAWNDLNALYQEMEDRGRQVLQEANVPETEQQFVRTADMRYAGQMYEISVPVPAGTLSEADRDQMEEFFHSTYRDLYGRDYVGSPIEALNWRLLATGPVPHIPLEEHFSRPEGNTLSAARKGDRQAFFKTQGGWMNTAVFDSDALPVNVQVKGPAIVEERETTILVPPDTSFEMDRYGNITISLHG